jgi:hypothetical protein
MEYVVCPLDATHFLDIPTSHDNPERFVLFKRRGECNAFSKVERVLAMHVLYRYIVPFAVKCVMAKNNPRTCQMRRQMRRRD